MDSRIGIAPDHVNHYGQDIYMIRGANHGKRKIPGDVKILVIHHTGGSDTRGYLLSNTRGVSAHYLVGKYPGMQSARVYKYLSERYDVAFTQGPAVLGGIPAGGANEYGISIELEGPPISGYVLDTGARLAASILDYWRDMGSNLVMLTHDIIQSDKDDPTLDWYEFCQRVYSQRRM